MSGDVLSATQSLCPVCLQKIPARRTRSGETVYLEKTCPTHGCFRTPVWRGDPVFEAWQRPKIEPEGKDSRGALSADDCPFACGLCDAHRQRTCTLVVEVTQRCNLHCAVCFADAGARQSADPDAERLGRLLARLRLSAGACNLQLSGGEPTMRDDLPDIVALARKAGFGFVQLNTNGLRLAADAAYARALAQAGLSSVFLQFDGTRDPIYRALRGRALLGVKLDALAACRSCGLGVVLVPTLVPGLNVDNVGDILRLAMQWAPTVRGVHFQPISYFGRYEKAPEDARRLTLPEVMQAIEEQTQGLFRCEHFAPPGCENSWCSFHAGYVLMADGRPIHLSGKSCCTAPQTAAQGAIRSIAHTARQWAAPEPLSTDAVPAGPSVLCAATPFAGSAPSLDEFIERSRVFTFTVSGMAFMDAWTLDLDRARECCIHVAASDGRRIPFCLYNLSSRDGRSLYRPC